MVNSAEIDEIDLLVNKARIAQQKYEKNGSQELFDLACQAVGWALMQPEQNQKLAELAVRETGLGNVLAGSFKLISSPFKAMGNAIFGSKEDTEAVSYTHLTLPTNREV